MPDDEEKKEKSEIESEKDTEPKDKDERDAFDFDKWLGEQTEDVQAAFADNVKGLKSALQSERDARKKEVVDRKKAEEDEARKLLEEQGKFKELAEQATKRAEDTEGKVAALTESVESYQAALNTYLTKAREGVPAHVLALLDRLGSVEQLEYLSQNRELLQSDADGIPPTPRPDGGLDEKEKGERAWKLNAF